MTQNAARAKRDFSATEGVYGRGALRFICKDAKFRLRKELRVRDIRESEGEVTWADGNKRYGTSSKDAPLLVVLGGVRLEVRTSLVKNQHGIKVLCSISGVVPEDIYDAFSVKPVDDSVPQKRKRRK